jgi:hypothetical protein
LVLLLSAFDKIRHKKSGHAPDDHFWIPWKTAQGKEYFCYRQIWNYTGTCTDKTVRTRE